MSKRKRKKQAIHEWNKLRSGLVRYIHGNIWKNIEKYLSPRDVCNFLCLCVDLNRFANNYYTQGYNTHVVLKSCPKCEKRLFYPNSLPKTIAPQLCHNCMFGFEFAECCEWCNSVDLYHCLSGSTVCNLCGHYCSGKYYTYAFVPISAK